MQQTRYAITIRADGPRQYRTQGAVAIVASDNPMRDAAKALIARGADPNATLQGTAESATISAMTLAKLTAPRRPIWIDHSKPRNTD